jgi:uncharacterized integral membrane protein
MSASPDQLEGEHAPPQAERRNRKEIVRRVWLVALAVLITLFAVLNVEDVKVHWIVGSGRAPLIIVIVISFLVGILLTHFTGRIGRKRRDPH